MSIEPMHTGTQQQPDQRQRTTTDARRLRSLVILAGMSAVLLAVLYVAAVRTTIGQEIDHAAIRDRSISRGLQDATDRVLNTISVSSLVLAGTALFVLAVARKRPRLAVGIPIFLLGANVTTQILKSQLLTRPDLLHERSTVGSTPSFPSGHATVAMSLALGFVLVAPPRLRRVTGVLGIAYAFLVGAGTLTGGWHRPSDVIGSYLIVTGWAAGLGAWLIAMRGTGRAAAFRIPWAIPPWVTSPRLVAMGTTLLLVASVVIGGAAVASEPRLEAVDFGGAYVGALAAIAGSALLLLAALIGALGGAFLDPPDAR